MLEVLNRLLEFTTLIPGVTFTLEVELPLSSLFEQLIIKIKITYRRAYLELTSNTVSDSKWWFLLNSDMHGLLIRIDDQSILAENRIWGQWTRATFSPLGVHFNLLHVRNGVGGYRKTIWVWGFLPIVYYKKECRTFCYKTNQLNPSCS